MDHARTLRPSLRRWGVLKTDAVDHALDAAPWTEILPQGPGNAYGLYAPRRTPQGLEPSPHVSVLLAELLELGPGLRIQGPEPRPLLLDHFVHAAGAKWTTTGSTDRVVNLLPQRSSTTPANGGFSLTASFEPHAETLVKGLADATGHGDLILDRITLGRPERPYSLHRLLALEGFLRRAIERRAVTEQDDLFREAVESTWDPPEARRGDDSPELERAELAFHLAYIHQFAGDPLDATKVYEASIEAFPTAEAHTFHGWTLSFVGDYQGAIRSCERAVKVDPEFGNPYNDVGAYYLELSQPSDALPWLERALQARRYDTPHFAHFNAGRALLALGRRADAKRSFERALEVSPGYRPASELLRTLKP